MGEGEERGGGPSSHAGGPHGAARFQPPLLPSAQPAAESFRHTFVFRNSAAELCGILKKVRFPVQNSSPPQSKPGSAAVLERLILCQRPPFLPGMSAAVAGRCQPPGTAALPGRAPAPRNRAPVNSSARPQHCPPLPRYSFPAMPHPFTAPVNGIPPTAPPPVPSVSKSRPPLHRFAKTVITFPETEHPFPDSVHCSGQTLHTFAGRVFSFPETAYSFPQTVKCFAQSVNCFWKTVH